MVGVAQVMDRDAKRMRGDRPFVFTNLKTGQGLDRVIAFIEREVAAIVVDVRRGSRHRRPGAQL